MLAGHKNPGIIIAEIIMTRQASNCSFLIVEGGDDVRFWEARRHSDCQLIDGEGKPNVMAVVHRLDVGRVSGVLGVVDEDYDALLGKSMKLGNLVALSPHDLECLLCQTSALDKVLAEYGERSKIESFKVNKGDIRAALLERTMVFGRLRCAALACGLNIRVNEIQVRRFLNEKTWSVDRQRLIDAVAPGLERDVEDCISRLPAVQPWRLVTGHDVLSVLRIGFRRVLGNLRSNVGVREIAHVLRAAGEIEGTTVLGEIRRWEGANRPYRVLQ